MVKTSQIICLSLPVSILNNVYLWLRSSVVSNVERFDVLTAVLNKIQVFLAVTPIIKINITVVPIHSFLTSALDGCEL